MASDINTGKAPCSNTAAAIDCLSPLVAIRLCDSLETAQPMLNTTLAIHLTSKKVDAFASVTHRLIQGYRFRVGPYRFCGASNPTTHSILLWSYLILSDAHIYISYLIDPLMSVRRYLLFDHDSGGSLWKIENTQIQSLLTPCKRRSNKTHHTMITTLDIL